MIYPVVVRCNAEDMKQYKRKMRGFGLEWTGTDSFSGNVSSAKYRRLQNYCHDNGLRYNIHNVYSDRSKSYRRAFFRENRPFIGDLYFCAYCGRLVRRKNVTVDHLYPIGNVKYSSRLQKRLKRHGVRDINSADNLVASCRKCNLKKGSKMGLWVIRGRIGRHQWVWCFRHMVRIWLIACIFLLFYTGAYQKLPLLFLYWKNIAVDSFFEIDLRAVVSAFSNACFKLVSFLETVITE